MSIAIEEIKKIADLRKSDVIVYCTGDKLPPQLFSAQIADDIVPLFYEQLELIKKNSNKKKLSLFLYSTGGLLSTPWPLLNLCREYCNEFEVIIPYKAFSAATLISLGADKIVMTPLSRLSPIDPTGHFQDGNKQMDIAVEDITSFFDFVKNKVGIKEEDNLTEALKELTKNVPTPVLGNINRTHSLIRMSAEKILLSRNRPPEKKQREKIIKTLTETLFSHQYFIGRKEAKRDVGLSNIEYASEKLQIAISDLFSIYSGLMQLQEPFNPDELLGTEQSVDFQLTRAVVHTSFLQNSFVSTYRIQKVVNPANGQAVTNVAPISNKWIK